MPDFFLKQHDRLPNFRLKCADADGVAVDLTGATAVLNMKRRGATTRISRAMTVFDAAGGIVECAWLAGDNATAGVYDSEVVVTFSDGREMTFPNAGYLVIQILPEI